MLRNIGQYNKAYVALVMAGVYFLNSAYGIEIPLDETNLMIIFSVITSLITYFVPNTKVDK